MKQVSKCRYDQYDLLHSADPNNDVIKIAMIGGGGVGKSALCARLKDASFNEDYVYSPMENEFFSKSIEVDGRNITLNIGDLTGWEELLSTTNEWIMDSYFLILVYAITCRTTFEEIVIRYDTLCRCKEDEWVGVLVGNKCDLKDDRQVSIEEGKGFADECDNIIFFESSAKDRINDKEIFYQCARWQFCIQNMIKRQKQESPGNAHNCQIL